jgi:TonB family protein
MLAYFLAAAIAAPVLIPGSFFITEDDYPDKARREGISGPVWYRVAVDASGTVKDCRILQGTWSSDLDSVVCFRVRNRARFEPARDASGNPVKGSYDGFVNWALDGRQRSPNAGHVVHVAFDPAGRVTDCIVKPMMPNAVMPADVHTKCDRQGNAGVFAGFLGRATQGLRSAEIRTFMLPEAQAHVTFGISFRNIIAEAEYDMLASGDITRCQSLRGAEAAKPPESRIDLCVLGGLTPNAVAGRRKVATRRLVIDAAAN